MGTFHMVSTTNTEDEIKQALGRRTSAEPVQDADAAKAAGEQPNGETESQDKPHKKGGFQRKIDKLEAQLAAERQQRQELMDRLAGKTAEAQPQTKADESKPVLDKFKNYDEYVEALTSWTVRQEAKKLAEQHATNEAAEYEQQIESEFQERIDEFKASHPDYDEVLENDIEIYVGVQRAIKEMDNGPAVSYFLGQNPDVAKGLMKMSPLKAITEVGKIAAKLAKADTPAPKPKTPPPPPITPVGGSSASTSTGTPGKRSLAEYRRLREEGRI